MQLFLPTEKFDIHSYLKSFTFEEKRDLFSYNESQNQTKIENVSIGGKEYRRYINEFWTAKQRQASALHEIAYRACFKPQLPRFFIRLLTSANDTVYDPFNGRGTTIIEAGLLGRNVIANDINPLSRILSLPRFYIPRINELEERLKAIRINEAAEPGIDLSMFYHANTLKEIVSLRQYLIERSNLGREDHLDSWIRMIATNRLTGHSPGFFSVYTLPPNQAVSPESQRKINEKRKQIPPYRDTKAIILRKSRQLIRGLSLQEIASLARAGSKALFLNNDARFTDHIIDKSIQLTVTSPPFLDIVQYSQDNWLRCWFNAIEAEQVAKSITLAKTVEQWSSVMGRVFAELYRITRPGGWVTFEVGEVRKGKVKLDEHVVPLGVSAGFECQGILVNEQEFTKTANIWGIKNNRGGTNTNRVVMFFKP